MTLVLVKRGGDVVSGANKFASKIGINLANWQLPGHQFTGPFIELNKRIDENGIPLSGYEPFNQVDAIARTQDKCYANADKVQQLWNNTIK